jgi:beta-glucosidase
VWRTRRAHELANAVPRDETAATMYDIFSLPKTVFPSGFLWGSATAAHQIEGDNVHSNHWAREIEAGSTLAFSGKACDHYRLYKEDAQLIADLGQQGYRMSVEWSRIEPEEGHWDEAAVAHYVDELEQLKSRGIRVFVTLHHFTHPLWFEKLGAFTRRDNLRYFERFVSFIVPRIAAYVDGWNVINEFNLPLSQGSPGNGPLKFNMILAHARGYRIIKTFSKAPVSTAHAFVHYFPRRRNDKLDNIAVQYVDYITNEFFFHAIRTGEMTYPHLDAEYDPDVKGSMDYWAVNYYTRQMIDARKAKFRGERIRHKQLKMIPMDFYLEEMYPEGLTANLERLADLPVYITENGCSCDDDRFRIVYLALHLSALKDAIDRGVDVRGYFYWSLMDNYEWGSYLPRFGLVDCDFKTFKRTPKPSALLYRDIIAANAVSGEMVGKYLKELPTLGRRAGESV